MIYDEIIDNLIAFGIASTGYVYSWDIHKNVRIGTTIDLDEKASYSYSLPSGYTTDKILGMAIAKSNDYVYTWYNDNNRSCGHSHILGSRGGLIKYYLPSGYTTNNVIDMGISGKDITYTWYKREEDGVTKCKVSAGNTTNLASLFQPSDCILPSGKTPDDIIGIAIAGKYCYAWYKDGTVSAGSSRRLDRYQTLHPFLVHLTLSVDQIKEIIDTAASTKKSPDYAIKCTEPRYLCPIDTELRTIMNEDTNKIRAFLQETNDTDDFSYLLKCALIRKRHLENIEYPYCVGLVYLTNQNDRHREIYNIAINSNGELICIDHQHDDIILLGVGGGSLPFEIEDGTIQFISF